jgi:serine protease
MDNISAYSNVGCCIDIYAPGQSIKSAWWDGNYALLSGTSMA